MADFYIISDKKDRLYIYDIDNNEVIKGIELEKFDQEGISFDSDGNIFIADDRGGIFRYRLEELGLR